jgi:hypothetical protein
MTAALLPTVALLFIYLAVLGAIFLAFRGTDRSVGVSLRRTEAALAARAAQAAAAAAGGPHEQQLPAPSSRGAPAALLLPPLDAALQAGGDLGEGPRPGFEDAGEEAWALQDGVPEADGAEAAADPYHDAPLAGPRGGRRRPSLLGGLEQAMEMPSVRRVPARERFELEARAARAFGQQQQQQQQQQQEEAEHAARQLLLRAARGASRPRGSSATAPAPPAQRQSFSPEARLMLPAGFSAPPPPPPSRPPARTIYPSEDATYGAAEFDVVVSPQQRPQQQGPEAARFAMTPEERILASHIHNGG